MALSLLLALASACAGSTAPGGGSGGASPTAGSPTSSRSPERPGPGDYELALDWGGQQRTYELHAPPSYRSGAKLPLVVVLHYLNADSAVMRQVTRFDAKADKEGFLVAYPNGLNRSFDTTTCCGNNADVGFIKAMVEHLVAVWGVDPDGVFVTGMSNGATMSFVLAVEVPGMFAAVAPVSGGLGGSRMVNDPAFAPKAPVSVVSLIGSLDGRADAFTAGVQAWSNKTGCTTGESEWADRAKKVARTVAKCADGTEVVSYRVEGMGHVLANVR